MLLLSPKFQEDVLISLAPVAHRASSWLSLSAKKGDLIFILCQNYCVNRRSVTHTSYFKLDLSDEQYLFDDNLIWSGCQVLSRVHLTTKNLDNRHVAVCTSDREGERRASLSAYTTYDGHLKCTGALNVLNRCNPCLYDTVPMLGHFMLHVVVRMRSSVEWLTEWTIINF